MVVRIWRDLYRLALLIGSINIMKNFCLKNQNGYAILFTVVIVSAVSIITAGLTSAIYKQIILSSLAKDSQSAFYQADTAGDCALYADTVEYAKFLSVPSVPSIFDTQDVAWSCGGLELLITPNANGLSSGYSLIPEQVDSPCFSIDVTKTITGVSPDEITETKIIAKGYNICDKTNSRTVEREIEINY